MRMKQCADLRKSLCANIFRPQRSAITAPGSGEIATASKEFLFICQANKNQNGF